MIRISLNEDEKTTLTRLRRDQKSNIGERAHYVLLADTGKSVSEIAKHLSRSDHTVRLWLKRYLEEGITGLKTKKPPAIELKVQELLDKSPEDYGCQINLLRDWFAKQGLKACDNTIVKSLGVHKNRSIS